MTFRLRLTLWYSALVMTIIVTFGIGVYLLLQQVMLQQADDTLEEVVNEVEDSLYGFVFVDEEGVPSTFTPVNQLNSVQRPGVFLQLWRPNQQYPLSRSSNIALYNRPLDDDALTTSDEVWTNVTIEGTEMRVITRPFKTDSGYTVAYIQAAISTETISDATDQLLRIMLIGIGIALLMSVLLGDLLARRALRPVRNITRTAEEIVVAEDLASRINYNGPKDELGYLITTLNAMIGRLEKLFNSQQRFVADVSHELRTPLTAIQSNLDMVKRYGVSDDKDNDPSLKAIESETKRMSRLVGDLLTLAQADLGYMAFIEGEVSLDSLLLDVFNQAVLISKGKVKIDVEDIDQISVKGDHDRIKQLLLNLATNAIKYTPEDGLVKLSLRKTNTYGEIRVTDTGIGIPEEDLPNVFNRFYRVDKARARAAGGSGLGLSIAKWIADAHEGELSVTSEVGKGTTFILKLPLKETKATKSENDKTPIGIRSRLGLNRKNGTDNK